jgi:hypothetical protein
VLVTPSGGAPALGKAIASLLRDPVALTRLSAGATAAAARFSAAAHVTPLVRVLNECRSSGIS